MVFSLILTGADRHDDLRRFFCGLLSQAYDPSNIQLIFVNQGDFDPVTEGLVNASWEFIHIKTQRIGLSKARNIALKYATGDICAFPDDDCWYHPKLISEVLLAFDSSNDLQCLCANVYDPRVNKSYGGRPLDSIEPVNYKNLFLLPISVGIFIRSSAFKMIGFSFNEQLGAGTALGSGEETELVYRTLRSGFRVVYNGNIQVYHPVSDYSFSDVAKFYKYGLGFGFLNGVIVRDGRWLVLRYFLYVALRSVGGMISNLFRSTYRDVYLYRLRGSILGFLQGVKKRDFF